MNALLRTALVRSAFVASGAVAGAGGTYAVTSGAHEEIVVALGDSLTPRFSVKTDSILKVAGNRIVGNRCGESFIFLRLYKGAFQVTADSIKTRVCGDITPPKVDIVTVCFSPVDPLQKYGFPKYDSLGRPLTITAKEDSMRMSWGCKDTIYLDSNKVVSPAQKVGDAKGLRKLIGRTPS